MNRYCLTLDLKNDPELIAEYEEWHRNVWPDVLHSIRSSGIQKMELYRYADRLFMILEVSAAFSFEKKALADATNEKVQEWEALMWKYQERLPRTHPGEKWMLMDRIFEL